MVSAARRQIIGGGAPINKSRRRQRPQIVGGALISSGCLRQPALLVSVPYSHHYSAPYTLDIKVGNKRYHWSTFAPALF